MERTEKIQKLCLKMNVSEKEADDALRACGDDILDAALYLEALGRVRTPSGGFYTEIPGPERTVKSENNRHASESFGEAVKRFGRWFVGVLKKGMNNYMEVRKNGETSFRVPLTIFVIALFTPALAVIVALLVVGLFFDYNYHFTGPDLKDNNIGNAAAEGCYNVARDIKKNLAGDDGANGANAGNGAAGAPGAGSNGGNGGEGGEF
ncbi:MAG: DUF4342 domain-containing protein [Lachnospiraceae bacterium]|nr:DUF4342 domain-containing protein [Lachnospiraceae bacterium]